MYIKNFSEYVLSLELNESKGIEDKIKNIARHLSHDKEVIKYLNTTRSKREIGWRDLLDTKLHGSNKEYINYITKDMVTNMNPKITGPVSIKLKNDDTENQEVEIDNRLKGLDTNDKIDDINRRLEDVEDMFGIDTDDVDTLKKAKDISKSLGFDVIERDEETREILDDSNDNEE